MDSPRDRLLKRLHQSGGCERACLMLELYAMEACKHVSERPSDDKLTDLLTDAIIASREALNMI